MFFIQRYPPPLFFVLFYLFLSRLFSFLASLSVLSVPSSSHYAAHTLDDFKPDSGPVLPEWGLNRRLPDLKSFISNMFDIYDLSCTQKPQLCRHLSQDFTRILFLLFLFFGPKNKSQDSQMMTFIHINA